ncbi:hypothetical protein Syun_008331 [Stephania yunnanensis]|uniref:DUF789 domain-containing protein n=1 Tax=Stephania yunnanensis TaxID=152371 RepID=A0AAP0PN21_9MAGN
MVSNLEKLLYCTTPVVPSQTLPKRDIRNLNQLWHPWERETVEYFTLGDLWSCYDEWSAYGAGVPILLNNGETVIQYYVPYLSALQIFTSNDSVENFREDVVDVGDYEIRDLFSDSCSDESESSDKSWRWESGSTQDYGFVDQVRMSNQNDRLGDLYFQYNEISSPYGRVPLVDKVEISVDTLQINDLAQRFPRLMTLKSVELSPASWMAVAWYPIYHIPRSRILKNLSASFLTFHTLSSSFQDDEEHGEMGTKERKHAMNKVVSLAPFGLATYKMQESEWLSSHENGGEDYERLCSLVSAADSWLKQLKVQHHDFTYFTGIQNV